MTPRLTGVGVGGTVGAWTGLGLDPSLEVGGVALLPGFTGLAFDRPVAHLPALPTSTRDEGDAADHPNGVTGVDHVVIAAGVASEVLDALAEVGLVPRGHRVVGDRQQHFVVAGTCLLEVVSPSEPDPTEPAAIWGVTFVSHDLDGTVAYLGTRAGRPRDAVQPGRRIVTLDTRDIGTRVAVMTPRLGGR